MTMKRCKKCNRYHEGDCKRKITVIKGSRPSKEQDKEYQRMIHSVRWTKLSKAIKQRDDYVCQRCLALGLPIQAHTDTKLLEVHHIVKAVYDNNLYYEPTNLITLCRTCHKIVDRKYNGKLDFKWEGKDIEHTL